FWAVNFATLADNTQNPDPKNVPLCPGNATAIAIAFPNGLPAAPKLSATACGNTQATPPFIFTPPAPSSISGATYTTVTVDVTVYVDAPNQPKQNMPTITSDPNDYPVVNLGKEIELIVPPS
ncbi:hypothetical protein GGF38_004516, partial [Coemansia sp. RSA 25]